MTRRTLAAMAALVLGATIAPALASTTPAAATTTAGRPGVALLVQYPSGAVRTWCAPYKAGITGADVLSRAKPTYGTGPYAGFVLTITGKGTVPPTTSDYWAYWRSTTGRPRDYAYASTGVTSTRPPAGSVEAWVWNSGDGTTFPKRSYATICPDGA